MANEHEAPLDRLWREYAIPFREFDDLTLARWLSQTLGQFEGRIWRLSHPLVGAYRIAAQLGHERQIWFKRLVTLPHAYTESACCRAPMLPLVSRDVRDMGLICQHCGETLVPFDEIAAEIQSALGEWANRYAPVHAVAHWDDKQQRRAGDYDLAYDNAAEDAERLLVKMGKEIAPSLLSTYPALVWEDQDECLEVRPEDVEL